MLSGAIASHLPSALDALYFGAITFFELVANSSSVHCLYSALIPVTAENLLANSLYVMLCPHTGTSRPFINSGPLCSTARTNQPISWPGSAQPIRLVDAAGMLNMTASPFK